MPKIEPNHKFYHPQSQEHWGGLSLREHYAGQIMSAIIAASEEVSLPREPGETVEQAVRRYWLREARAAVMIADCLLEALSDE